MCQMNAVVERDGKEELVQENLTRLDVLTKGIRISSLFEGVTELTDMTVDYIDFMAGKVFLQKQ